MLLPLATIRTALEATGKLSTLSAMHPQREADLAAALRLTFEITFCDIPVLYDKEQV